MTFVTPELDGPLDWQERLAVIPADATTRGMFLTDLQDDLRGAGKTLPNNKSYIAFKSYPLVEYLGLVRYTAEALYPELSQRAAVRKVGQSIYPRFQQTMVGRSIFAFAGNRFASIVKLASKAYSVSLNYGRVEAVEVRDGYARIEFRELYALPDVLQVGNWEGAMQVAGVTGQLKLRAHSRSDVDYELHWK